MLNSRDLKEYRLLHGLSQRDVAMYCDVSYRLIGEVENGQKNLTDFNYHEIIKGINSAVQAKPEGLLKKIKRNSTKKKMNTSAIGLLRKKLRKRLRQKRKALDHLPVERLRVNQSRGGYSVSSRKNL